MALSLYPQANATGQLYIYNMTKSTALSNLRWSSIPKALVHSPVPAKVGGKRVLGRDITLHDGVVRRDVGRAALQEQPSQQRCTSPLSGTTVPYSTLSLLCPSPLNSGHSSRRAYWMKLPRSVCNRSVRLLTANQPTNNTKCAQPSVYSSTFR